MLRSARLARSLAAAAVLTAVLVGPGAFQGAGAAITPEGTSALTWLADQVDANDGLFVYDSGFGDFADYGLTLDAVLALALGGDHSDTVTLARGKVEDDLLSYVTDQDFGDGSGRFAGSLAKALLAEKVSGGSSVVDGFDLEAELRARIQPSSDTRRAGRLSDAGASDYSNGFGHALGVLALARTTAGVPESVLGFLLEQQCDNGGFRIAYDVDADFDGVADAGSSRGCATDAEADVDSTSLALGALLAVQDQPGIAAPVAAAIEFLEVDAALDNANSLGLAAQALRAAQRVDDADQAAAAIATVQLTAGPDLGAIAFDDIAFGAVVGGDIADADLPEFWRATAQGALAFGLASYGPVAAAPVTTTTSTSVTSTTVAGATTSTSTTVAGSGAIAKTGSDTRTEVLLGMLLLGSGLIAVGQGHTRGRRSP